MVYKPSKAKIINFSVNKYNSWRAFQVRHVSGNGPDLDQESPLGSIRMQDSLIDPWASVNNLLGSRKLRTNCADRLRQDL